MYRNQKSATGARASVLAVGLLFSAGIVAPAWADCGYTNGSADRGDAIYHETCVACHGEDGRGTVPGAPDFTAKGGPLSKPHAVMMDHIKNGFHEDGVPLAMPPKGANPDLTDADLEDVHAYLHKRYGCGA